MQESHATWLLVAGGLLVASGIVGAYYAMPELIRGIVTDKVVLKDDSEALKRFIKTPQPLEYKVYIWHVENPDEVSKNGARPILTEKGPYVYDQYRERVDLKFHKEDDTVSFFSKSTYHFNQEKSGCKSENDEVTVIHAPILGTALKLATVSSMGLAIFNDAIPLLFEAKDIFATTKVRNLLFDGLFINCSYPEDSFPAGAVCQGLRARAPNSYRRADQNFYFSFFAHSNGTSKQRMRMYRGLADPSRLGRLKSVAGNATLSVWRKGTPCNLINGSDASIFTPFQQDSTKIPIFQAASCRSLNLVYHSDSDVNDVPTRRYVADVNMLASGRDFPPNRCFCVPPPEPEQVPDEEEPEPEPESSEPDNSKADSPTSSSDGNRRRRQAAKSMEEKELDACLPKGAMDMSLCFGSPVVLTFPHFYLGAKEFLDYPIGLSPKREKHQTAVDIEPMTGIPMRGAKRIQLNMFLKKMEEFDYLKSVSEGLFPILWVEEGTTLEGPNLEMMVSAHRGVVLLEAVPWVLVALGVLIFIIGVILKFYGELCARQPSKSISISMR